MPSDWLDQIEGWVEDVEKPLLIDVNTQKRV